jgi:transposase
MSADGYKVSAIAGLFKVRSRTIYTWFDRWEEMGIAGLMILPGRGIKSPLDKADDQQVKQIRKAIQLNPQNLYQVCEELSQTLGFKVTKNMLKRFIKKNLVTVGEDFASP